MGNAPLGPSSTPRRPYVGCTADSAWQRAGLAEATVFDVYEIGGLLGSGSFGQVRLCWPVNEPEDGGKYAVKVVDMKSEVFRQATTFISARQEANILKAVRHPHIVELVDVFEKERWLFLVLECVSGGELFGALSNPNVSVTEACIATVGRQLFGALRYLHDMSVVHRDVKAENILLASNPAKTNRWHIKLIDFGLATRVEQSACLFQMCKEQEMPLEELICGTAYYCAPEVWVNDYSPKVDVWAAGVVLYLALYGSFPFYDADAGALESLICNMDKRPTFKPVCAKECPEYEVSGLARETLSSLLCKDQECRPTASDALSMRWMRAPKRAGQEHAFPNDTNLPGRSNSSGSAASDVCLRFNDPDYQIIPVPVRVKAGKAATRPPVDPNKEQSRTKALEALKRRAALGGLLGGKMDYGMSSPASHASSADLLGRTPRVQSREFTAECPERRGGAFGAAAATCGNVLGLVEHDTAPTDTSLTDSDVDDGLTVCTCR